MIAKGSDYVNESAPWIAEYVARMRLAKLGFTQPYLELDCLTAEAMLIIDGEIESIKADEMKKAFKK